MQYDRLSQQQLSFLFLMAKFIVDCYTSRISMNDDHTGSWVFLSV